MKLIPRYVRSWQSRSAPERDHWMEKHLWQGDGYLQVEAWAGNPAVLLDASHKLAGPNHVPGCLRQPADEI